MFFCFSLKIVHRVVLRYIAATCDVKSSGSIGIEKALMLPTFGLVKDLILAPCTDTNKTCLLTLVTAVSEYRGVRSVKVRSVEVR